VSRQELVGAERLRLGGEERALRADGAGTARSANAALAVPVDGAADDGEMGDGGGDVRRGDSADGDDGGADELRLAAFGDRWHDFSITSICDDDDEQHIPSLFGTNLSASFYLQQL
jgi:hypothetical protein